MTPRPQRDPLLGLICAAPLILLGIITFCILISAALGY